MVVGMIWLIRKNKKFKYYLYKPQQLSEEEVKSKVQEAIQGTGASSMQDIGKVMGVLKTSLAGSADMGMVSKIVKEELS